MSKATYTLEEINHVARLLEQQVEDVVERWRQLAAEGDESAAAYLAEWERPGDPE